MIKQVHVFFSGSVQGVGFRYTARRIAQRFGANGWVRNLPDGRVELVAQAEEAVLYEFLSALRDEFSGYIRDEDLNWHDAAAGVHDFGIRF